MSCNLNNGDISLMMAATAFVMLQTPAMGIAQSGMIRRKNSLSMLMQTLTGLVIGSIMWFSFGFSLTFGTSYNGIIGNDKFFFVKNISLTDCIPEFADSIPGILYLSFQMMFAIMVPIIVTGSWAEKMTFNAFLIFVILWPILIYYPIAHWVWNPNGWLNNLGVMDFAGGITIHTASGCAAFIAASSLQPREKFINENNRRQHHNIPLSILGGSLIWAGWYSFNGGSALKANSQAVLALLNTHMAGCSGAFIWTILAYYRDSHWHLSEIIGGAYAGLAAVTPGSGYISPISALIIGLIGGITSFYSVSFIKNKLNIDDVLDVASLQGVAGAIGSILVGIFSESKYQENNPGVDGYIITGNLNLFYKQCIAVLVTIIWSGIFTKIIFIIIPYFCILNVTSHVDEIGLDFDQIGENAYDDDLDPLLDGGIENLTLKLCESAAKGKLQELKKLLFSGADIEGSDYDGRSPITLAAAEGHFKIVKYLYNQHGASLSTFDRFNRTPLDDAIDHGHIELAEWLMINGAKSGKDLLKIDNNNHNNHYDIKYKNIFEIFDASKKGLSKKLLKLLENDSKLANYIDYDGRTPMHLAANHGNASCIQILLSFNANPSILDRWKITPKDEAMRNNHLSCIDIINEFESKNDNYYNCNYNYGSINNNNNNNNNDNVIINSNSNSTITPLLQSIENYNLKNDDYNKTNNYNNNDTSNASVRALCLAARRNDLQELKRILIKDPNAGSKSDYDNRSALHIASAEGYIDIVIELLKHPTVNVNKIDRAGRTPLQDAISLKRYGVIKLLRDNGGTVIDEAMGFKLCTAVYENDINFIKECVEMKYDISVSDYDARTCLHIAAAENKIEIVKYLIEIIGLRPDPIDCFGHTPLQETSCDVIKNILINATV